MWKLTLCCNILILAIFWLISLVVITPSYNHLVRYADHNLALPIITDFAIRIRLLIAVIPLSWAGFSFLLGKHMQHQTDTKRGEYLMAHTSVTLCVGLAMLLFFSLASIVPILRIDMPLG